MGNGAVFFPKQHFSLFSCSKWQLKLMTISIASYPRIPSFFPTHMS